MEKSTDFLFRTSSGTGETLSESLECIDWFMAIRGSVESAKPSHVTLSIDRIALPTHIVMLLPPHNLSNTARAKQEASFSSSSSSSSSLLDVGCRREPGLDFTVHVSVDGQSPLSSPGPVVVVAIACPRTNPFTVSLKLEQLANLC